MVRELVYLSHEITDIEMCPTCHRMTIAVIEVTTMTENGVNGGGTIRRMCEECHPEIKQEDK